MSHHSSARIFLEWISTILLSTHIRKSSIMSLGRRENLSPIVKVKHGRAFLSQFPMQLGCEYMDRFLQWRASVNYFEVGAMWWQQLVVVPVATWCLVLWALGVQQQLPKLLGSFLSSTVLCLNPQSSYLLCGLPSNEFHFHLCQADP